MTSTDINISVQSEKNVSERWDTEKRCVPWIAWALLFPQKNYKMPQLWSQQLHPSHLTFGFLLLHMMIILLINLFYISVYSEMFLIKFTQKYNSLSSLQQANFHLKTFIIICLYVSILWFSVIVFSFPCILRRMLLNVIFNVKLTF